jgi:hypothetical protein
MEGLPSPTGFFFTCLGVMILFPVSILAIVFILLRYGKSPERGKG